jgi:hypothetical protein
MKREHRRQPADSNLGVTRVERRAARAVGKRDVSERSPDILIQ